MKGITHIKCLEAFLLGIKNL